MLPPSSLACRAACYTKLGAWNEGLKDAEECIRLEPSFAKGYSRKGHLQYFMKVTRWLLTGHPQVAWRVLPRWFLRGVFGIG